MARLTTKGFTIVPLQKGVIHVLHDGRHDRVLGLLQQRRLTALRAFAVIDGANAPQAELRRFTWLKDQGAITEPEFEAFSQKRKALSLLKPQRAPSTESVDVGSCDLSTRGLSGTLTATFPPLPLGTSCVLLLD